MKTAKQTSKMTTIRPGARVVIEQSCAACNGTGEASDGALCVTCWGMRYVTLHVTLAELAAALAQVLAAALAQVLPETVRVYSEAAGY